MVTDLDIRPLIQFSSMMAQAMWTRSRVPFWRFADIASHSGGKIYIPKPPIFGV